MRTFVLRARKASVSSARIKLQIGSSAHAEIIAHVLMNAFFTSNQMRDNVEVYIVLDSSANFPKTLRFISHPNLSFPGFNEQAIMEIFYKSLQQGENVKQNQQLKIQDGIEIFGFGFDKLMQKLLPENQVYILDKKGSDIRELTIDLNPIFVLSDHLELPKNSVKVLERNGAQKISLGKKMLFASQCIVLIHNELDRVWFNT